MLDLKTENGAWLRGRISSLVSWRLLRELNSEVVEQHPGRWFVRKIDCSELLGGSGFKDPKDAAACALAFVDYVPTQDPEEYMAE
jgi:hypothetical protein